MGVVVSSGTATSPFFLASGIVGFVSFGFTLGTFIRVIWTNLETLCEAPHEVHTYLTNLRTELLEERASLRGMRKGMRKHKRGAEAYVGMELDEVSLKMMADVVRNLIKRFKELERPFLAEGEPGIEGAKEHRKRARRRNSSVSPSLYDHAAYSSPPEKSGRGRSGNRERGDGEDDLVDEEAYWAQRTRYADLTLGRRMVWLGKKAAVQSVLESVNRLQTRRIAMQVGGMAVLMHEYGCETVGLQETVRRIDERVNRVVGVRRVD